uniref:Uncharacterized protein n=1 Tax=Aegilops tauschii subsp. strangulata TaxID=200361 RepID=A0A453IM03_AEGTS
VNCIFPVYIMRLANQRDCSDVSMTVRRCTVLVCHFPVLFNYIMSKQVIGAQLSEAQRDSIRQAGHVSTTPPCD